MTHPADDSLARNLAPELTPELASGFAPVPGFVPGAPQNLASDEDLKEPLTADSTPTPARLLSEERLTALDLIRGIAILGILPANLPHFCGPLSTIPDTPMSWPDRIVASLVMLFVDVRCITMLAILFGIGLTLQFDRARARGDKRFSLYYLRRQFLLLCLGLCHAVFIWYGDILATYAIVGSLALGVLLLGPGWTRWVSFGGLVWFYTVIVAALIVFQLYGDFFKSLGKDGEAKVSPDGPPLSLIYSTKDIGQRFQQFSSQGNMVRIYRQGSLFNLIEHRTVFVLINFLIMPFVFGWYLLGCFLIGAQLLRAGLFHDPQQRSLIAWRMIVLGLVIGVPAHVVAATLHLMYPKMSLPGFLNILGALPHALMYMGLFLLWDSSQVLTGLQARFRSVGQMALTNYLAQSLIFTCFYNGYGLGFYGYTGLAGGAPLVLAVWLLEMFWSPIWLRHFTMGPVEWAWRSIADGKIRPLWRTAPAVAV